MHVYIYGTRYEALVDLTRKSSFINSDIVPINTLRESHPKHQNTHLFSGTEGSEGRAKITMTFETFGTPLKDFIHHPSYMKNHTITRPLAYSPRDKEKYPIIFGIDMFMRKPFNIYNCTFVTKGEEVEKNAEGCPIHECALACLTLYDGTDIVVRIQFL